MSDRLTPGMMWRAFAEYATLAGHDKQVTECYLARAKQAEEAARREAEASKKTCGPEVYDKALKSLADDYDREGLGSAAAFALEVGFEYRRRDGTGPVVVVGTQKPGVFVCDDGCLYLASGHFFTPNNPASNDLVALWQAEAQAPQPDDLVQRLRMFAKPTGYTLCEDAADRIEAWRERAAGLDAKNMALAAERDALKARVEAWKHQAETWEAAWRNSQECFSAERERAARLEDALQYIAHHVDSTTRESIRQRAFDALAGDKQ